MPADICRFAQYELDWTAYQLRRKGRPVPMERIPLEVLFMLADRRGQLVTREEILERVWGKGVFLDTDNAINTAVRKIRHALHDDSDLPRFVETVPAKGYRFVALVRESSAPRSEPSRARLAQNSLVGRDREMAKLCAGLDAAAPGRGGLFLISGEPGVGKTRLADELAAAARAKGMTLLVGHCSEHDEAVAYLPFVEILETFIDRALNVEVLRIALGEQASELARLLPKLKNILPDLPPALDLPPAQSRRHLFNCFFDFAARIATEEPTLMILEDLHWADDSTLSLLDHLTQRLSDLPLMVIGTYRDSELDVTRGLAKTLEDLLRGRLATRVRLKGLPRDDVAAMLESMSGKSPPAAVVSEIFAETEGNPFFVEELFRHLEEENRLYDSSGQFRPKLEIAEVDAPPSVRLVVARRLARLSDLTQKMLATAAVIGRFFSFEILRAATEADADSILECIEEAEKAELVYPVTDSPRPRFEFSHELARQAVIGGLSAARRQRLHLDIANAMERIHANALEDHWADLAHHYRLGGNLSKAVDYLVSASEQASARSAHQEAISLASSGLELLDSIPHDGRRDRHQLELLMTLGGGLNAIRGYAVPEVERSYARALELCGRIDQTLAATRARLGLHAYYTTRADFERATALQEQLLDATHTLAEPALVANIHYSIGFKLFYQGDFEAARHHLEQVFRYGAGHRVHAYARAYMALTVLNLGYPDKASRLIKEAASEANSLRNPFANTMVADISGSLHMTVRDAAAAEADADNMSRLATKYGFSAQLASSVSARGWANAWRGDPHGIDLQREAIRALGDAGSEITFSWQSALIAELCLKFDRVDEALAALDDAMAFVARTGEGFAESEIYRLKGEVELHLGRSHFGAAAKWFERAIDAARKRSARIAELRATASLARLLDRRGKRNEARAMLADIYGWFTEGFDTHDLKEAKALLKELD
jgi:DNA-binding winged helix-turn-helix (wHTH) protein/tetratricopeptide (TPR) repeat protein